MLLMHPAWLFFRVASQTPVMSSRTHVWIFMQMGLLQTPQAQHLGLKVFYFLLKAPVVLQQTLRSGYVSNVETTKAASQTILPARIIDLL